MGGAHEQPVAVRSRSVASSDAREAEAAAERALLRKLDWHIIPLVMALYLFSFLDRINIGNARLYHLEADLGLTPAQFQTAVSLFFLTYLLFELPSNLALKRLTPRRWIAFLAVAWGLVATCAGLVASYPALLACRLLLGAFEAGLFPGLAVYLTLFYTKRELAVRLGYLFVSAAVAADGAAGWHAWRWIFVEGLPSILLGLVTYVALPNDAASGSGKNLCWLDVRRALCDWKVWAFSIAQLGVDTMLYGFSTFLPTIVSDLGTWTPAQVQLLTVPCYVVGAAAYMGIAVLSDRLQVRGLFCVVFEAISVLGYAVLLAPTATAVHYFACFLVAGGLYVVIGLPPAWLPNNCPHYGKRTTGTGLQLTFGNVAGVMVAFICPQADKPRYTRGHAVTLSMVALGTLIYAFMYLWYRRANAKRDSGEMSEAYRHLKDEELRELGDESPCYRYTA